MTLTRRQALLILAIFAATRILLTIIGTLAVVYLPSTEGEEFTHLLDGGPALDMWYRWDAGFYATIATEGYDWMNEGRPADDMAFLPLYPLLIRGVMTVSQCGFTPYQSTCATVGGLLVSNVALLAATFLLFDLTRRYVDTDTAWRAVWLLMLSPGSIFFSGVYTESLFLLLSLLTFWLLGKDRFVLAVLVASLAALTRSVGVALVPALLWAAWRGNPEIAASSNRETAAPDSLSLKSGSGVKLALALIPGLVFAAYILAAGNSVGDPLAYFHTYSTTWKRPAGSVIGAFTAYFSGEPVSFFGWELSWIDLFATLGYLALAVWTLRRRVAQGVFALFGIFIPIASGTLVSIPRYGTALFPFYLTLAGWARRRWQMALLYGISFALMVLFTVRFVTWKWIA